MSRQAARQKKIDDLVTKFIRLEGTAGYAKFVDEFVEKEMREMDEPELLADHLHKALRSGGLAAIPAFKGILYMVLEKNFAVDNLYDEVYKLLRPSTCYSKQSTQLFELVDQALTSPYIPQYMLFGFAKKLARLLLFAPADQQTLILNVLKNICCTHKSVFEVMANRSEPGSCLLQHAIVLVSLESDPFDEKAELANCRANESSLWELKAIHNHWYIRVADRSKFIHGNRPEQRGKVGEEDTGKAIMNKLKTSNSALNPKFGRKVLEATKDCIVD